MPVINGTNGHEYLAGTSGDDTINGLDGHDNLEGFGGDDLLDGGAGAFDYAVYTNATSGVTVDLSLAGPQNVGGGQGVDTLVGIEGVIGSAHGDTLLGDGGENNFTPDAGDDLVNGGAGLDRVQYWGATSGVTVNLGLTGPQAIGGGMGTDTLVSIERAHGGSYNDLLIGSANPFGGLSGEGGDDTLQAVSDWTDLHGGAGNDLLQGSGLHDQASYWDATGGVRVDLNVQGVAQTVGGGHGVDTLVNIDGANGSMFNDTLIGNGADNYFQPRAGDDRVEGGGGRDNVDYYEGLGVTVNLNITGPQAIGGGMGVDTLVSIEHVAGSWYSDHLIGNGEENHFGLRTGSDTVDGGGGHDGVHFGEVQNAIFVDLALSGENVVSAEGNDTLISIESVDGTSFSDTLLGTDGDNGFEGRAGDDTIDGRGGWDVIGYYQATGGVSVDLAVTTAQNVGGGEGIDTLSNIEQVDGSWHGDTLSGTDDANAFTGMAGDDVIDGRGGFDALNYWSATGGVTVNLSLAGPQAIGGGEGVDTLLNIENINATQFADHLTGNEASNFFSPNDGNDTHFGLGGNDNLQGGRGDDFIDGGEGSDNAGYFSANAGVTVDLRVAGPQAVGADQGVDTLVSIENVGGSDLGHDHLTGSGVNNFLNGNGGNDTLAGLEGDDGLQGGAGHDSLDGGLGNDFFIGGAGNDTLVGGGGFETAQFSGPRSAYSIVSDGGLGLTVTDLRPGSPDGADALQNIWRLQFSDGLVVIGGPNADQLFGGPGSDALLGMGGDDVLRGQAGNDSLAGGEGHDYLVGALGNDTIDGGAGFDRASYFNEATGVAVDLAVTGPQSTGMGVDTLVNVENVSGTPLSDTLAGTDGANWLWGSAGGDDQIFGRGGDDLIWLGAGGHNVDGGDGVDTVGFAVQQDIGGAVNVSLVLQGAAQTTGRGAMTLANIENLSGSTFNDTLSGDAAANLLAGHLGDDVLNGGEGGDVLYGDGAVDIDSEIGGSGPIGTFADMSDFFGVGGSDTLNGGGGDDTLTGGRGDDRLNGEAGQDRAVFTGAQADYQVVLLANGDVQVTDTRANGDGVDVLTGVERLAFSDGEVAAPTAPVDDGPAERLEGGNGKDVLRGEGGNDTLLGGNGQDELYGGTGADVLVGGNGADLLAGGAGNDTLTGENGPDVFVFGPGQDRVTDFDNTDQIQVGGVFTSFDQVMSHAAQQGADVVITSDAGDSIRLVGMSLSSLNAGDFLFG